MSIRHQIAALERVAQHGTEQATRNIARANSWEHYADRIDPDHALPERERQTRGECAMRAAKKRAALARWGDKHAPSRSKPTD